MGRAGTRTAVATLVAVLACGLPSSGGQAQSGPPVVAVVLTDGKLLPLAAVRDGGEWQLLPWPRHEFQIAQASAPVPQSKDAIPRDWFTPLASLPSTWRLQAINGARSAIHVTAPTRWQVATFDAIGLGTDYEDPDPAQRSFDFNAGIAVAGDVETLPVRELDESSPEWAKLVARHTKSFLNADHADARKRGVHLKGRTTVVATKELRAADVSLYRVEIDAKHAYEYFEVTAVRQPDPGAPRPACPTLSVEYFGLIDVHGRTETVRWLSTSGPGCGNPSTVMEVVGGLRSSGGVRLVVEYSGDNSQSFAVVNPLMPESQIRRTSHP